MIGLVLVLVTGALALDVAVMFARGRWCRSDDRAAHRRLMREIRRHR